MNVSKFNTLVKAVGLTLIAVLAMVAVSVEPSSSRSARAHPHSTTTTTVMPTTTTTLPPATTQPAPTTTTLPPVVTSSRQEVLAWLGTVDLDTLGPTGIATLKANGIGGAVVMLGICSSNPIPSWQITEWTWVSSQGDLYVGCYLAAPAPASTSTEQADQKAAFQVVATAAKSAGAKGFALDAEPYGGADTAWNNVAGMKAYGQSLASVIGFGQIQVYPSSNASWPGSYNDLIQLQDNNCPGQTSCYANNKFGDFIDGLLAGGARVNLTDASFHWGPQLRGDTWQTGVQRSVSLAAQRFPSTNFAASVMLWPDNDEGHGAFSPDEMQYAFDMATRYSTGPVFLYQHTLAGLSGTWPQWLAAIKAGTAS